MWISGSLTGEILAFMQAVKQSGGEHGTRVWATRCHAAHCLLGRVLPFVESTPARYARKLAFKRGLQLLGCYHKFRPA